MAGGKHEGHLGNVYDAKSADEVARLYDSWSESYDADMRLAGYRHPSISLALLARHVPRSTAPLLDAGAGTGLIGVARDNLEKEGTTSRRACWPWPAGRASIPSCTAFRWVASCRSMTGLSRASSAPGCSQRDTSAPRPWTY